MTIEEHAAIILNNIGDGVLELDRDFIVLSVNDPILKLMKSTREKVVGRTCYEFFHKLKEVCPDCPVKVTFETGESASTAHEGVASDGTKTYVELTSYPIKDSGGKVVTVVETVKDLSERKNHEKEMEEKRYLERISKYAIDRELKMVELKKEIKKLKEKLEKYEA
jgi:PAS domain S-box-containing protein